MMQIHSTVLFALQAVAYTQILEWLEARQAASVSCALM